MIETTKAYKTSDGITHDTLEGAQIHALDQLQIAVPKDIMANKDAVLAILKLKSRKPRKAKNQKTDKAPAK